MAADPLALAARRSFIDGMRAELTSGADRYHFITPVNEGAVYEDRPWTSTNPSEVWIARTGMGETTNPITYDRRGFIAKFTLWAIVFSAGNRDDMDRLEHDIYQAIKRVTESRTPNISIGPPYVLNMPDIEDWDMGVNGSTSHTCLVMDLGIEVYETFV